MKNLTETTLLNIIEECGEVVQAAAKLISFGSEECCPRTGITNREQLKTELCQLLGLIELLEIDDDEIDLIIEEKYDKLDEYKPLKITDSKREL